MDSRKGGTPTGRRPDGGSTGVFCIKKQYAGILSANESGVSKLKENRSSKEQRDLLPLQTSDAAADSKQNRSGTEVVELQTRRKQG